MDTRSSIPCKIHHNGRDTVSLPAICINKGGSQGEITNSDIHWMEPRDLDFDQMSFRVDDPEQPGISSPHSCGPAVVFADSIRAYRLDQSLHPETIKAMLTISGGEGVIKDGLYGLNEVTGCNCLINPE